MQNARSGDRYPLAIRPSNRAFAMTLSEILLEVWRQAMTEEKRSVEIEEQRYPVRKIRSKGLRTIQFDYDGRQITGIEQNPRTRSRWAELARKGERVMQFSCQGKYVGNVTEGKLLRYPAWHTLQLPD
jgi:hypothetical protein